MTTVVNCSVDYYDVFIGRPSKWGNPFSHHKRHAGLVTVPDRATAIRYYYRWVTGDPVIRDTFKLPAPPSQADVDTLRGKRLGCYCAPLACHGHVLAALADGTKPLIIKEPDGTQYEQLDWTSS